MKGDNDICVDANNIQNVVLCPYGQVTRTAEEMAAECEKAGLKCPPSTEKDQFQCVCNPCKPACSKDRELSLEGTCKCAAGNVDLGGKCLNVGVLVVITAVPSLLGLISLLYLYMQWVVKRNDKMWHIRPSGEHLKVVCLQTD